MEMELDMWNGISLWEGDVDRDLSFYQDGILSGDLKPAADDQQNGLCVGLASFQADGPELGFKAENSVSVDGSFDGSVSSQDIADEGLALWMESSGLDNFDLNALPMDSSLYQFESLISTPPVTGNAVSLYTQVKEDVSLGPVVSLSADSVSNELVYDALLTTPESPEQVAPAGLLQTKTEPISPGIDITAQLLVNPIIQSSGVQKLSGSGSDGDTSFGVSEAASELISILNSLSADPTLELSGEYSEFINSPLTADDVESTLSFSEPTSPASSLPSNCSLSIVESSPELYKVISTSSLGDSLRYSPYQKSKPVKESTTKKAVKRRPRAQPIPEEVIVQQVDKKDRKKMQNKNAAIRYRQKKKDEALDIKSEEQQLEDYNSELKTKVADIEREIKYMKSLMVDVLKAKGLLTS